MVTFAALLFLDPTTVAARSKCQWFGIGVLRFQSNFSTPGSPVHLPLTTLFNAEPLAQASTFKWWAGPESSFAGKESLFTVLLPPFLYTPPSPSRRRSSFPPPLCRLQSLAQAKRRFSPAYTQRIVRREQSVPSSYVPVLIISVQRNREGATKTPSRTKH